MLAQPFIRPRRSIVRRLVTATALIFVTLPVGFSCSSDEPEPEETPVPDAKDDIELPEMGGAPATGQQDECQSFTGLSQCDAAGKSAKKQEVQLLLAIDKSGSMEDTGGFQATKWATMEQALQSSLTAVQDRINVGLSLYPFPQNPLTAISQTSCADQGNCCEMPDDSDPNVPVGPGEETVPKILEQFKNVFPGGGTPTAAVLNNAYDYFVTGAGKELSGERYVVLATDGGPNCNADLSCESAGCTLNIEERGSCEKDGETNCCAGSAAKLACLDDQASLEAIERLRAVGIDTFVIGVPGSEQYADVLDALAEKGGRALTEGESKYFQVQAEDGVDALTDVFKGITETLVTSCDIQLENAPPSLLEVNVAVDCDIVPQKGGAVDGQGGANDEVNWRIDSETSPPTIRLEGELCERVKRGVKRTDVVLGCPAVY